MSRARNRKILLSGGTGIAQRLAQLVASVITLPLVLHALGIAGFGVWGAATSLAWLSGMLDLGLGSALVTLVPQAIAGGTTVREYITASLSGGALLGGLLFLGGALLAVMDPNALPSAPFLIAGACLAVNIPLSIAANAWFGLQKGYIAGIWELVQTGLMLALLVLSAALGAGISTMVASVFAALVLANAGSLAHLFITQPALRPAFTGLSLPVLARVLRTGLLLSALTAIATCGYVFDNVFTLDWLGPDAAARMTIAMRLCVTAFGFLTVASQALWPAFVEAVSLDDHGWVLRAMLRGTLAVVALALAGSALIVAFGAPALRWWLHQDLHIPPLLFWAMGAWITVMALPRVAGLLLNAVSVLRNQLIVHVLATSTALALKFFLAQRFGAAGILAATPLVWLVIVCPAYAWLSATWIARPKLAAATS